MTHLQAAAPERQFATAATATSIPPSAAPPPAQAVWHPPQVRAAERRRASESELVRLEETVSRMEAEQEAVFTSVGEELDAACRSLAGDGHDKLEVSRFLVFSGRDCARFAVINPLQKKKKNPTRKRCLRGWLGAILHLKFCQAALPQRLISLLCLLLMHT